MATAQQKASNILQKISDFLKAVWIFFPSLIFLALGLMVFTSLSAGKDVIYQSADPIKESVPSSSWLTAVYLVVAAIFWVFTTWYTSRMIAYNHEGQNKKTPWMLNHFPRLLAYSVLFVLWLAVFLIDDYEGRSSWKSWIAFALDILLYLGIYYPLAGLLKNSLYTAAGGVRKNVESVRRKFLIARWIVRAAIVFSCLLIIIFWRENHVRILLWVIPVLQVSFLFLVVVRHPLYESQAGYVPAANNPQEQTTSSFIERYMRLALWKSKKNIDLNFEKQAFIFYHVFAFVALLCYFSSINSIAFARELKSFPLVLLAFGILLGFINFIALISRIFSINLNFFLLLLIFIAGFLYDPHKVRLIHLPDGSKNVYDQRMNFRHYVDNWVAIHKEELESDSEKTFPLFFVLADGGASRSGYWAASVLSRMHEGTKYHSNGNRSFFMDHLFCLSGASGGEVGNTVFLSAYALQQKDTALNTTWLSQKFLGSDFLAYPLARMLGPEVLEPLFFGIWLDRAYALEYGMDYPVDSVMSMGRIIRKSFSALLPNAENKFPILSINTTRVNDGRPGVLCTINVEDSIFGKRIDVLDSIPKTRDIAISTAMILGARFPYMSPGGKLADSYFVDGGYFDNSGAGMVNEILSQLKKIAADSSSTFSKYAKKIRFYVIHLANTPYASSATNKPIHPLENDLAAPLLTLAGSYSSQTSMNDSRLSNYLKEMNHGMDSCYVKFNLYTHYVGKDKKDSVGGDHFPMNWVISKKQRDTMQVRTGKREIDSVVTRMVNKRKLDSLFYNLGSDN